MDWIDGQAGRQTDRIGSSQWTHDFYDGLEGMGLIANGIYCR
jgi:hypothetical protein